MSKAADLEHSIMLMLAEAAEDNVGQLGIAEMADRFRPPIPFRKVEIAADHLVEIGHAKPIEYPHAMTDYRATQTGLNWVDEHYDREDDTHGNTQWVRKPESDRDLRVKEPTDSQGVQIVNNFSPTNTITTTEPAAQKAGLNISWAGWVGVGVAVIGIVVALWIGGKL